MTFQISKNRVCFYHRVLAIVLFCMAVVNIKAQEVSMQELLGQSLSKLQQPTPEAYLNCIAELKRIDTMFPDSIQPKYQIALQSLCYAVMNPHADQVEAIMTETEQVIAQMKDMKKADSSDICTLTGFLYMVRIVQDPVKNGQRYYLDVMQNYEKALKLNPDNQLAKQLQQQFYDGMRKAGY